MLPKKNRLNSLFFKDLFRKGTTTEYPHFSLRFVLEKTEDFHCGVIISKKVASKAVERNLLKRRFLSLIQENNNLLVSKGYYVFYLKKEIITISRQDLSKEIQQALSKLYEKYN